MKRYVEYKAGPEILPSLRDEGLDPCRIGVFAGPAGGPKWFVSVGFDRALMETGFLQRAEHRVLLVGSSAGGWRCLAMASAEPLAAYENLRIAYSRNVFTRYDTPVTVSAALRSNVDAFISDHGERAILENNSFDVAIHAVRARGLAASSSQAIEGSAIVVAGLMNAVTPRAMDLFYERVVFYAGSAVPRFLGRFRGRGVRLTERNLRPAALATGSLPYIVAGVRNIPDAPPGVYRDGGLIDYQFNQDYCPGSGRMTLFFHYQERIVPGWFDKKLTWRRPPDGSLNRVLHVYPSRAFVDMLPDGRLPDRDDFITFVDDPAERIRRWDKVAELSTAIGEQFFEDVESGRIRELVRPL